MPTAAKLAAALCLALTALATTHNIIPLLPESQPLGRIYEITIGLAFLVGWINVGNRVGRNMLHAVNNGVTGGFILVFWGLVVFSFLHMWKKSFGKTYDDPFEALQGFFDAAVGYVGLLTDLNVLASLVIGSIITGIIAEIAGRNFN